MLKKIIQNAAYLAIGLVLFSCSNNQNKKNDKILDVELENEAANKFEDVFGAPSPDEILSLFEDSDMNYNEQALNDPEKVSSFISTNILAINLGVYVADAAYLNMFKQYSQMTPYLESVFKIVDKLDLGGVYAEFDFKKVFREMDNMDSLIVISEGVYHAVTNYMIEHDNEKQLCLISYGSMVELLYISLASIDVFDKNDLLLQHIFDQQLQITNIIEFSSQYSGVAEIDLMNANLARIEQVFMNVEHEDSETELAETDDGKLKISGGKKQGFTEKQFVELKTVVSEIRQHIVN